jgi:hypothetical protein
MGSRRSRSQLLKPERLLQQWQRHLAYRPGIRIGPTQMFEQENSFVGVQAARRSSSATTPSTTQGKSLIPSEPLEVTFSPRAKKKAWGSCSIRTFDAETGRSRAGLRYRLRCRVLSSIVNAVGSFNLIRMWRNVTLCGGLRVMTSLSF